MKIVFAFYSLLWFGSSLWTVSDRFVDSETIPKWYIALYGVSIGLWICNLYCIFRPRHSKLHPEMFAFSVLLCAVSQALYGIWQWHSPSASAISGSFDNPAGLSSLLALSIPFGCYGGTVARPGLRRSAIAGITVLCLSLLLTESRSGIVCTLIILFLHFQRYIHKNRRSLYFIVSFLFVLITIALYRYKKDSADGRLLIWQCAYEMVKDSPWTGHGSEGFRSKYMNYQAQYFRRHPDSRYTMLADDVKHPFNEYLRLMISHGFIGVFALSAVIILLIRAWRRSPGRSSDAAAFCLIAAALFSLFSYPFRYPHTWILCICSAVILIGNAYKVSHRTISMTLFFAASCTTVFSAIAFRRMKVEMKWAETAERSLCGMTEEMLPVYEKLYTELYDDPLFLYNYAAELNVAGRYEESLQAGKACERKLADYFTQLLLADNCKQLKRYDEAKRHLIQASFMCPNRFVPLYELYKIHEIQQDSTAMQTIGHRILKKPVKVDSPEIRRIIREVKQKNQMINMHSKNH